MTRIILHAGPGKCGSSTIQALLAARLPELEPVLIGQILKPALLRALDTPSPDADAVAELEAVVARVIRAHPGKIAVFSHEVMFKTPLILTNMAKIALRRSDDVKAIAYVRPQSDFLVSSFGQWLFRKPKRLNETAAALRDQGIDPELFWGIERHLITAILHGWQIGRQLGDHMFFDWSNSVPERRAALPAGVVLDMGVLPRRGIGRPLPEDFLSRVGVDVTLGEGAGIIRNRAFTPGVIEAVVNVAEAGFATPHPHQDNRFLFGLSDPVFEQAWPNPAFIEQLKTHVDTAFEGENMRFARQNGLPEAYFAPAERLSRARIEDIIKAEVRHRAAQPAQGRAVARDRRIKAFRAAWSNYCAGREGAQ